MRLPYVEFTAQWMIFHARGVTALSAALLAAPLLCPAQATKASPPAGMTLLGIVSEWKYPGSNMLGGASMSDGGNPLVRDVRCKATLTTADPIEKVAKYYSESSGPPRSPATATPELR